MKAVHATQLLKRLEPAVRPGSAAGAAGAHQAAGIDSCSFDELLALARTGKVKSGRQIEVGFDAAPPLLPSQLERLAVAADRAQAAGVTRALMLIDGRGFVLDVESRTLTAELSPESRDTLINIDAALFVESHEQLLANEALPPPPAGAVPAAIARQLASRKP